MNLGFTLVATFFQLVHRGNQILSTQFLHKAITLNTHITYSKISSKHFICINCDNYDLFEWRVFPYPYITKTGDHSWFKHSPPLLMRNSEWGASFVLPHFLFWRLMFCNMLWFLAYWLMGLSATHNLNLSLIALMVVQGLFYSLFQQCCCKCFCVLTWCPN